MKLEMPADRLVFADGRVFDAEDGDRGVSFADAVQFTEAREGTVGTVGSYTPPRSPGRYRGAGVGPSPAYSYTAAVVEVEVDPDTGIVRVPKAWVAHDVGQCINRMAVLGQVEGSVYMGLGETLMEEMVYRENRGLVHKIPSLLEYKSPTTLEMCDVETLLIEDPDPNGPFGAKEVGQGPLLPIPPAVANAIYDAVGVRVDEVPIGPEKVLRALKDKARGGAGRTGPTSFPDIPWPEPTRVPTPWEGGDGGQAVRRTGGQAHGTSAASAASAASASPPAPPTSPFPERQH
jgi:CO/xanthine dehydrogenase Mo-binding subunit